MAISGILAILGKLPILSKFFGFIKFHRGRIILVLIAAAVIFFYWNGRTQQIKKLTEENQRLTVQIHLVKQHYESELDKLSNVIDKNNKEIDVLKERGEKLKKKISEADKKRESIKKNTKESVSSILKEPTPKNCEDAIQYLIDGVKQLQW